MEAEDHIALAMALARCGDRRKSIEECEAALRRAPGEAELFIHLAGALQRILGLDDAEGIGNWPETSTVSGITETATKSVSIAKACAISDQFFLLRFGSPALKQKDRAKSSPNLIEIRQEKNQPTIYTFDDYFDKTKLSEVNLEQSDSSEIALMWSRITSAYENAIALDASKMPASSYYCLGLGLLFSAFPILITLYVVENTTPEDYGPSFSAATLAFGITQIISPPVGGLIADMTGSFTIVFLLAAMMGLLGLTASLRLPRDSE